MKKVIDMAAKRSVTTVTIPNELYADVVSTVQDIVGIKPNVSEFARKAIEEKLSSLKQHTQAAGHKEKKGQKAS